MRKIDGEVGRSGIPPIGEEEEEVMSMSIDEIDEAYSPGARSHTEDYLGLMRC